MFRCNVPWNFDWTSPLVKQKWFTAQHESLIFPNNLSKTLLTLEEATKERTTTSKQIVWATIYGYQVAKYEWCLQKFNLSQYNCIFKFTDNTNCKKNINNNLKVIFKFSSSDIFLSPTIKPLSNFSFIPDVYSRCPDGHTLFNGRCFILTLQGRKFDVAEAECNKLPGGHLAAIRSTDDFEFLKELRLVHKQRVTNHSFHIDRNVVEVLFSITWINQIDR